MFCHQCGERLREKARFCFNCGAPVRKNPGTEVSATYDKTPADLHLENGRVSVSGGKLYLARNHYIRKTSRKKFRKNRKMSVIPFESILSASMEHNQYGGRIFLSLLLLVFFAAGTLFSVRCSRYAYDRLNAPYRDSELADLEDMIAIIENDGAGQLLRYQESQEDNRADAETLSARLAELEARQTQEILAAAYASGKFDLDAFFNRDLFARAYQDYLQELLDVFKADEQLHSWLFSYYKTTGEYGGNSFLDTDIWIYDGSGEDMFSPALDSAAVLMDGQYGLDLYEHILYTGRIYVTGADFMQKILSLPRYVVDGAIFARACGGVPDPAAMSVPGWGRSDYEEFWLYGADYYSVDTPMWLDYGLSAASFRTDWNSLVNEPAYYTAYRNFMDKIDPNLPCYDTAVYHADDEAYGGMGYSLKGAEASLRDIVASYAENHPEFTAELRERGDSRWTATSVDGEIARTKTRLETLDKEFLELQELEKELAQILADEDRYRNDYSLLLADIRRHTGKLSCILLLTGGTALLCMLGALACLFQFSGFACRPGHLFLIRTQELEYAFHTRNCPEEELVALQGCLSGKSAADTAGPSPESCPAQAFGPDHSP